jgi:hypothetical protein
VMTRTKMGPGILFTGSAQLRLAFICMAADYQLKLHHRHRSIPPPGISPSTIPSAAMATGLR